MDWLTNLFSAAQGGAPGMGGGAPTVGPGAAPPGGVGGGGMVNPAMAAMGGGVPGGAPGAVPGGAPGTGATPGLLGGFGGNPRMGNALAQQAQKLINPGQIQPAQFSPLQIGTGLRPGQMA